MKKLFTLFMLLAGMSVHAQQGYWNGDEFVKLTPDEAILYKYVQALDEGSQTSINELYESMKGTDDQSILRRNEGGWYVKKDYPLPDGNYYESFFYNKDSGKTEDAVFFIYPKIQLYVNNSGQISDLLEILGDKVSVEDMWTDLVGGTDCKLKCNMKTSEEVLEMVDYVSGLYFQGLAYFLPNKCRIDRSDNTYLINMLTGNAMGVTENDEKVIYQKDWEGVFYNEIWEGWNGEPRPWETTADGLAITTYQLKPDPWGVVTYPTASDRFSLEKGHSYVVRLILKVPADGTYHLGFGNWEIEDSWYSCNIPVTASDGFQVIEVECQEFPGTAEGNGFIDFGTGWVLGTTVLKYVEVIEKVRADGRGGTTTVKSVKAANTDSPRYNLAGQKVAASYKGIVIQNGKKRIVH